MQANAIEKMNSASSVFVVNDRISWQSPIHAAIAFYVALAFGLYNAKLGPFDIGWILGIFLFSSGLFWIVFFVPVLKRLKCASGIIQICNTGLQSSLWGNQLIEWDHIEAAGILGSARKSGPIVVQIKFKKEEIIQHYVSAIRAAGGFFKDGLLTLFLRKPDQPAGEIAKFFEFHVPVSPYVKKPTLFSGPPLLKVALVFLGVSLAFTISVIIAIYLNHIQGGW